MFHRRQSDPIYTAAQILLKFLLHHYKQIYKCTFKLEETAFSPDGLNILNKTKALFSSVIDKLENKSSHFDFNKREQLTRILRTIDYFIIRCEYTDSLAEDMKLHAEMEDSSESCSLSN